QSAGIGTQQSHAPQYEVELARRVLLRPFREVIARLLVGDVLPRGEELNIVKSFAQGRPTDDLVVERAAPEVDRQPRRLEGGAALCFVGTERRLPLIHARHAWMAPQADDAGLRRNALGSPEIADLHVNVGHPAALAADMLEDLDRQRAIMFDVLGVDHGYPP